MRRALPRKPGRLQLAPEEHVGGDVHRGGDGQVLVDGLDAVLPGALRPCEPDGLAVQPDLALVRGDRTGESLDQAGLAGAVVADDGEDLAGQQVEVGAVDGGDMAVPLDQAAGLEHGCDVGGAHRAFLREIWSTVTARITRTPVIRVW